MSEHPAMTKRPPSLKVMAALERVFAAEIDNRLPFVSKAAIYRKLLEAGLLRRRAPGYRLTPIGRQLYCSNAERVASSCRGA